MMILGIAAAQWLVVVAINLFKRTPKVLIASSIVLAIGLVKTDVGRVLNPSAAEGGHYMAADGLRTRPTLESCALIEPGMSAEVVRAKLGKPAEVRDDGKTRGPGAVTWVYRHSRCAVHLLDETVELVE